MGLEQKGREELAKRAKWLELSEESSRRAGLLRLIGSLQWQNGVCGYDYMDTIHRAIRYTNLASKLTHEAELIRDEEGVLWQRRPVKKKI